MKYIHALFVSALFLVSALPANAQNFNDVTRFSINPDADVPSCTEDEALSYDDDKWICVANYFDRACGTGKGLKEIKPDGTFVCDDYKAPSPQGCPTGKAVKTLYPDGHVDCVDLVSLPKCDYPTVLTSHDGVNWLCEPGTANYSMHISVLTAIDPGCHSHNALVRTGNYPSGAPCFPEPSVSYVCPGTSVASFSASCTSACNTWCQRQPNAANPYFSRGTVTEFNDPGIGCTCLK